MTRASLTVTRRTLLAFMREVEAYRDPHLHAAEWDMLSLGAPATGTVLP